VRGSQARIMVGEGATENRGRHRLLAIGAVVVLAVLAGADRPAEDRPLWTSYQQKDQAGQARAQAGRALTFSKLVDRARPAVVAIRTTGSGSPSGSFPFNPWQIFPDVPRRQREEGIGSGFLIRSDGLLVTNHHVVSGAESLRVSIEGMSAAIEARVIGSDPRSDIALLKIDAPRPLPVLPLGNSDSLQIGAWVVAIGNPFGLTAVATKGIVSGKGRALGDLPAFRNGYFDFIQTDAAIDLGNSGGPLINLRGEVVGINTAINSRARGIGFAVPVDLAKAVLLHLDENGRVIRSYLGISVDPVTWELAESFGLENARGVVVTHVLDGKPADRAGMHKGDVLLEYNGMTIEGAQDVGWKVSTARAGKVTRAVVWRSGQRLVLEVTPAVRKSDQAGAEEKAGKAGPAVKHRLGLLVMNLDEKTAAAAGLGEQTHGVVVIGVQADAAAHGIMVGDVITSVNGEEIDSREDFDKAVEAVEQNGLIRFYVLRQHDALYIALHKRWE